MKVILLKDVAKIGRRFEVVTVPDGYALNKLLPFSMAKPATPENLKQLASTKNKQHEHQKHDDIVFADVLAKIDAVPITVEVEANSEGGMFQVLQAKAVSEAIARATGVSLSAEHVEIASPIKSVGAHSMMLTSGTLQKEITVTLIAKSK